MPDLPDDIESLKQLLTENRAALAVANLALHSRDLEIEALKLQLSKLKRMQFGRRSEQLDAEIVQLQLALDSLESGEPNDVAGVTQAPVSSLPPPRRKPVRKPLPDHLPRDERRHQPASIPFVGVEDSTAHVYSASNICTDLIDAGP